VITAILRVDVYFFPIMFGGKFKLGTDRRRRGRYRALEIVTRRTRLKHPLTHNRHPNPSGSSSLHRHLSPLLPASRLQMVFSRWNATTLTSRPAVDIVDTSSTKRERDSEVVVRNSPDYPSFALVFHRRYCRTQIIALK
jgi:hypothetical protein